MLVLVRCTESAVLGLRWLRLVLRLRDRDVDAAALSRPRVVPVLLRPMGGSVAKNEEFGEMTADSWACALGLDDNRRSIATVGETSCLLFAFVCCSRGFRFAVAVQ